MKEPPKYLLIAEKLKHEIETGEYQPNDQLPKEFDLAKSYNVSRITVRNAMKELENQGLIYRIQGAGTYVKERDLKHATVNSDQLELINLKKYKLKLLDFEVGQVIPKITEALNIQSYDIVYTIKRAAIATNKQLVAFQKICIPAKVIQGLNMEMMESSIYPLVKEKLNVKPEKAVRETSLVHATDDLINQGEVKGKVEEKEPLLKWLQKSYLADGRAFEWNETYYRITKFPIKEVIVL